MNNEIIIYILIAGVFSLALAIFMYGYRSKIKGVLKYVFITLRFLTYFGVLLLIINPKFKRETYRIEKPFLPILVDNSASVEVLNQKQNTLDLIAKIKNDQKLNEKFDIDFYSFGSSFEKRDTFSFNEKNTNIALPLKSTIDLNKNQVAPVVLITDGNQTLGADYEFVTSKFKSPVFPVILDDSIQHTDLKIEQVNTNRYAFLKNKFPVEVLVSYNGNANASSDFVVYKNETVVYRESLNFDPNNNSRILNFTLPAESVGIHKYTAEIVPLSEEKNKTNNRKPFAVEVIDQAVQVLLVSAMSHPDLGALKKAITSNEQRKITLQKPLEAADHLDDYQLIVLYQPDRSFSKVFENLQKLKKNYFIFTGQHTDWAAVNHFQKNFVKKATNTTDLVQADLNAHYSSFAVEDIHFSDMPPLHTVFGNIEFNAEFQPILNQTVNGYENGNPLIATMEISGNRIGLWDGDGFWRWRAASYLMENDFQKFDNFIGSLVQYLASNKRRTRLEVASENFYYNNKPIKITAQYFDKNYVFDTRGNLEINLKNRETEKQEVYPLLLKNNYYEVDLGNLEAGEYAYEISVDGEVIKSSGSFSILDFDVEQQFLNADFAKLQRLASRSNGEAYFISQADELLKNLAEDPSFNSIQKAERKTIPLIEWKYLLAFIVIFLSTEWFIRKYIGLT